MGKIRRKQGLGSRLKAKIRHAEAHIRRTTARIVSTNSHRDRQKSESINILTPGQVLYELTNKLSRYKINELLEHSDMFDKGEVIADGRSQGSQQTVIANE